MFKRLIDKLADWSREARNLRIHTDIQTMKEAWAILNEVGIAGLLTGDPVEIQAKHVCDVLLDEDKLVELVTAITHKPVNAEKMLLSEALGVVQSFFTITSNVLAGSLGRMISLNHSVHAIDTASKDNL